MANSSEVLPQKKTGIEAPKSTLSPNQVDRLKVLLDADIVSVDDEKTRANLEKALNAFVSSPDIRARSFELALQQAEEAARREAIPADLELNEQKKNAYAEAKKILGAVPEFDANALLNTSKVEIGKRLRHSPEARMRLKALGLDIDVDNPDSLQNSLVIAKAVDQAMAAVESFNAAALAAGRAPALSEHDKSVIKQLRETWDGRHGTNAA
ncbi:MAG TPA: hypothetical protein VFQ60_04275 [Patescibacteria group bacterium]|nr:hypothetical protein [Patescibacteria group bacterium]